MPQEEHMRGLTKLAWREYEVKEPGNLISWMSDELDIKLTLAEERLTQLKSMRQHYLHYRCTSSKCFEEIRRQKHDIAAKSENESEKEDSMDL